MLITSFYKVVASSIFGITDYLYCLELQENGYPHLHALLATTRHPVQTGKIKQSFPFRYTMRNVKHLNAYVAYIHKEQNNLIIKEYCRQYGTPQIYSKAINRNAQADAQAKVVQEKGQDIRDSANDLVLCTASATVAPGLSVQTNQ